MKTRIVRSLLALVLLSAAVAHAQPPPAHKSASFTEDDRKAALRYLASTRAFLLSNLEGLSEAQWRFKPGVDRWSIAEIAEHIALAEDRIFETLGKVVESPPLPADRRPRLFDEAVIMAVTNRTARRFQAPEAIQPGGRFATREELLRELERLRERTLRFASETSVDLRAHAGELPVLGLIDAHQYLLFAGAHAERHTLQIEEVKADPRYPR